MKEFDIFVNIVCHSFHVFRQYCVLYEESEKRIELLNEVARCFFADLQNMWHEHILLDVCKLTDPSIQGKNRNMTLNYWIEHIDSRLNHTQRQEINAAKIICDETREKVFDARRKIIAHIDYAVTSKNKSLGAISREELNYFYQQVQIIMNIIYDTLKCGPCPIDLVAQFDAKDLVERLKKAIHYDQLFGDDFMRKHEEKQKWKYKEA